MINQQKAEKANDRDEGEEPEAGLSEKVKEKTQLYAKL